MQKRRNWTLATNLPHACKLNVYKYSYYSFFLFAFNSSHLQMKIQTHLLSDKSQSPLHQMTLHLHVDFVVSCLGNRPSALIGGRWLGVAPNWVFRMEEGGEAVSPCF